MTLDEAMADLSIQLEVTYRLGKYYQANAIELGIEALKRIQECRLADYMIKEDYLPGETEE